MMINRIQLKVLLMDSITRAKFGSNNPLVSNSKNGLRKQFKKEAGLKPNCDEVDVLTMIAATYEDAGQLQDFIDTMIKFKMGDWITIPHV